MNVAILNPHEAKPLVDIVPVAPHRPELLTEYALQRVGSDTPSSIRFSTATEAILAALAFAQIRNLEPSTIRQHGQKN